MYVQLLAQSKEKFMLLNVIWKNVFKVTIYLAVHVKTWIVLMPVTHKYETNSSYKLYIIN